MEIIFNPRTYDHPMNTEEYLFFGISIGNTLNTHYPMALFELPLQPKREIYGLTQDTLYWWTADEDPDTTVHSTYIATNNFLPELHAKLNYYQTHHNDRVLVEIKYPTIYLWK